LFSGCSLFRFRLLSLLSLRRPILKLIFFVSPICLAFQFSCTRFSLDDPKVLKDLEQVRHAGFQNTSAPLYDFLSAGPVRKLWGRILIFLGSLMWCRLADRGETLVHGKF